MIAPRNITTINISRAMGLPASPDCRPENRLTKQIAKAENRPENLLNLSRDVSADAGLAGKNAAIPPPVLDCSFHAKLPEFASQADIDKRWTELKEYLTVATLREQEILDVLSSGILHTDTGRAISALFEGAMLRSTHSCATLSEARLKAIVDVLCHLPPGGWQAALGKTRFSSGQSAKGVSGFIQHILDDASAERDRNIVQKKLVSNVQWDAIGRITQELRPYVRSSNTVLREAWQTLKDDSDLRPSCKAAGIHLAVVIAALKDPLTGERKRWNDPLIDKVVAVHAQLMPDYQEEAAHVREEARPDEHVSLRFHNEMKPVSTGAPARTLLENLQSFERHANFYTNVSTAGPRIPETVFGKLLYACNVMDTFNSLSLDSRHLTVRPNSVPDNDEQASSFLKLPLSIDPQQPEVVLLPKLSESLWQFSAEADEILNKMLGSLMPWDSAYAMQGSELVNLLESARGTPEPEVSEVQLTDSPALYSTQMRVVGEQLSNWLARMGGSLLSAGVAVLGRTGDLIERHPAKAAGSFAVYMMVSNFVANWFVPEPEPPVDPLHGLKLSADAALEEESVARELRVEGTRDLLAFFPEFETEVKKLVSKSNFLNPGDDPRLIDDLETLLQRPVPGHRNVTFEDYLHEITVLAGMDAHDEFEDEETSRSTTKNAVTPHTVPSTVDRSENIRKKRSVDEARSIVLERAADTYAYVLLLIEAAQRSFESEMNIRPGETIAPGVTTTQAADLFINDFVELHKLLDPSLFILSAVEDMVNTSDLSAQLKSNVDCKTLFKVNFDTPRPNGKNVGYFNKTTRYKMYTLAELLMGRHEKEIKAREEIGIEWPSGYTVGFKNTVERANLWKDYEVRSGATLSQPKSFELWKDIFKYKLKHLITDYLERGDLSESARATAEQFLKDEVSVRSVGIMQGKYSDKFHVSNAVFLSRGHGPEGLFVFLGGDEKIIESPMGLFKKDGSSIDEFPQLRDELSKRIPLKDLLARDDDDFKYSQGRFEFSVNPIDMFDGYKWPYSPIIFGRKDGLNHYGEYIDVYKDLFDDVVSKAISDMDTMTSTKAERLIDKLMGILTETLTGFALILTLPGAPAAGIAFMMGASASASQYARGLLTDDPLEAARHKANSIKGMVGQIAGRYVGLALGRGVSAAVDSRIATKVFERLRLFGFFPKEISNRLSNVGRESSSLLVRNAKVEKWIPARARNTYIIEEKMTRKFTNNLMVDRLKSLVRKGPEAAQKLITRSRVLYFGGPKEGYVYRGFVMRGDSRSPQDVFLNGFKASTSAKNLKSPSDVVTLREIESTVRTSGYYNTNGVGAFYKGGGQGGYTYLIDGRNLGGRDVARNIKWQSGSGSRAGSNPYKVDYRGDISGSQILGAYNSAGKFIPNPYGLNIAIKASIPKAFVNSIPFPIKPNVQDKETHHAVINHP